MLAVVRRDAHVAEILGVQAAEIDAIAVRMRARHVVRLYSAHGAEQVLGGLGIEFVGRQLVRTRKQAKAFLRHDQVQITGLGTDGAVAVDNFHFVGCQHLEGDRAAMAAALFPGRA